MPEHRFPHAQVDEFSSGIPKLFGARLRIEQKSEFLSFVEPHQSPRQVTVFKTECHQSQPSLGPLATFHADPIAPLRQRDEQALDDIFNHAQVEKVVADIHTRLHQLCPEPCWDDDPFDFLKGYL